jgi:hypothetical protein
MKIEKDGKVSFVAMTSDEVKKALAARIAKAEKSKSDKK